MIWNSETEFRHIMAGTNSLFNTKVLSRQSLNRVLPSAVKLPTLIVITHYFLPKKNLGLLLYQQIIHKSNCTLVPFLVGFELVRLPGVTFLLELLESRFLTTILAASLAFIRSSNVGHLWTGWIHSQRLGSVLITKEIRRLCRASRRSIIVWRT